MNNIQLQEKLEEIIKEENFFIFEESLISFEKEYKTSDFYKRTKRPLRELVNDFREWQPRDIEKTVERIVNSLDEEKILQILDRLSQIFEKENNDIIQNIKELDLNNFWNQ